MAITELGPLIGAAAAVVSMVCTMLATFVTIRAVRSKEETQDESTEGAPADETITVRSLADVIRGLQRAQEGEDLGETGTSAAIEAGCASDEPNEETLDPHEETLDPHVGMFFLPWLAAAGGDSEETGRTSSIRQSRGLFDWLDIGDTVRFSLPGDRRVSLEVRKRLWRLLRAYNSALAVGLVALFVLAIVLVRLWRPA